MMLAENAPKKEVIGPGCRGRLEPRGETDESRAWSKRAVRKQVVPGFRYFADRPHLKTRRQVPRAPRYPVVLIPVTPRTSALDLHGSLRTFTGFQGRNPSRPLVGPLTGVALRIFGDQRATMLSTLPTKPASTSNPRARQVEAIYSINAGSEHSLFDTTTKPRRSGLSATHTPKADSRRSHSPRTGVAATRRSRSWSAVEPRQSNTPRPFDRGARSRGSWEGGLLTRSCRRGPACRS